MDIHFSYLEIHTQDAAATLEFYGKVFGKAIVSDGEGGGMSVGDAYFSVTPFSATPPEFGFDVNDLEMFLARLSEHEIEYEEPSEIESGGRKYLTSNFTDPDGRLVSVFQPL